MPYSDNFNEIKSNSCDSFGILDLIRISVITLFFIILLFICYASPEYSGFLAIFLCFIILDLCVTFRDSQSMVLLFLYILTHVLMFLPYFFFGERLVSYTAFHNEKSFSLVVTNLSLFLMVIWLGTQRLKNRERQVIRIVERIHQRNNTVLFSVSVAVMVFIILFGRSGESIFVGGGYGSAGYISTFRGLAIYEYFVIFFLVAFKYSNRKMLPIMFILAVVYSGKAIVFGSRNELLQLGMLIFILFFEGRYSYKVILLLVVATAYTLSLFGVFRANLQLTMLNMTSLNLNTLFATQSSVIYSSAVIEGMRIQGFLPFEEALEAFFWFAVSIFVPSRAVPEVGNLTRFAQTSFSRHGGGGIISSYFFTWLGLGGVFLIAVFFVAFLRRIVLPSTKTREITAVYQIMLISNVFRWFTYSPITLFKLSLYAVIVFMLFGILESLFVIRSRKH